jgi:hypothetical protein
MYASSATQRFPVTANCPTPRFLRAFTISNQIHTQWAIYVTDLPVGETGCSRCFDYLHLFNLGCLIILPFVIAEQCTRSAVTENHIIPQDADIYLMFDRVVDAM